MADSNDISGTASPTHKWHTVTPSHRETLEWIDSLYSFIDAHRKLCNAHTVDFFTCEHWENVVPELWRKEFENDKCLITDDSVLTHCEGSLGRFLQTARSLSIPLARGGSVVPVPDQLARFGMTTKKCHEVASFSEYVAHLTSGKDINQILDIGSGKGYLSQYLALKYGKCVVGMDTQQINTEGAQARNKKVCKVWKCISRMSKNQHSPVSNAPFVDNTPDELYLTELFEAKEQLNTPASAAEKCQIETETCNDTTSSGTSSHTAVQQGSRDADPSLGDCRRRRKVEETAGFFPLTQTIPTHTALKESERDGEELLEQAEVDTLGRFSTKSSTCLVGLHSCGDLGGVALRLFLRQPQLNAVCVVGCCYHHITEGTSGECLGFPMSSFLLSKNASLGRTARMLACQAASRISTISSGTALESVFRRAVLQIVLQRFYPSIYKDRSCTLRVGRLRKPPESFPKYASTAIEKLGLESTRVSPDKFAAIYKEFEAKKKNLSMHLKLRAVLASCVESLILLDRLLFLKEQKFTEDVSLVQLFDPEISPRCVAVVATKLTTQ